MKDALGYYKILQIGYDADDEAIKNAYRQLAKQWHPDSNPSEQAAEMFKQISEAYGILSDENSRAVYNVLSLAYDKNNYPDMKELKLATDGVEDVNLKVVDLYINNAWFSGCQRQHIQKPVTYAGACRMIRDAAKTNWLKGWWHYKTFIVNIWAIMHNLVSPISNKESLKMLLGNMIAHKQQGNNEKSLQCGELACGYLNEEEKSVVRKFLSPLGNVSLMPKTWSQGGLLINQLGYFIAVMGLVVLLIIWGVFGELLNSGSKSINYYQNVNTGYGAITDDMVVGKVLNIPVDLSDEGKLYHLKSQQKIMYGPSEKFDVLKVLPENTTVRLTGLTPDNVWARVMIDNGEMGFVRTDTLSKGRGIEPPFGSKIVQ